MHMTSSSLGASARKCARPRLLLSLTGAGLLAVGLAAAASIGLSSVTAGAAGVPLGPGTHNDTVFTYTGTWSVTSSAAYYQADDHRTGVTGNTYQVAFDGTQARLYSTRAPGMGIMRVTVDGGTPTDVDLYSPTRATQVPVYSTPELPTGIHTVTATVTGLKNPAATGKIVNADRVDISAPAPSESPTPTPGQGSFFPFESFDVRTEFRVDGAGKNVDTIAFWEAPTATDSLMFVTSKSLSLVEVWHYPFRTAADQRPALTDPCLKATADSASNGVLVDQESDLLYVSSLRSPNVCVFSLPDLTYLRTVTSNVTYGAEPNLGLIKQADGSKRLYVSNDTVVYVHDAVTGQLLSQFIPLKGLEAMWGDSFDRVLYVPDETGRTGVYAYNPDGTPHQRGGTNLFGSGGIFNADAEGILEYSCPASGAGDDGSGLIIVSDQRGAIAGNDYEVFDRRSWQYLGKIKLLQPSGTGFIFNTDGIGTTQQGSVQYPGGLFTAIHNNTSVAGVGWNVIFEAITAKTGRTFGCGT
jgi:hypothetical protein